jgi:hypothetical protein
MSQSLPYFTQPVVSKTLTTDTTPRRVVAKVEWHPGELYPRVGFIVTNLARPARARRRFLQPARHSGAMDQRGQGRDQVDPAVMPNLRG